jgi:hypothetical protein
MNFYDKLVKETEKQRQELYTVPQLIDGLSGSISRDTYIAYLTEAYHHERWSQKFGQCVKLLFMTKGGSLI